MRRLVALGCCAAHLAFGFVAGAAHVHESADHHADARGVHLDHAHLGEAAGHEPAGHDRHVPPDDGDARVDARHVGHHGGDAVQLSVTTLLPLDSRLRVMPVTVSVGATIDAPVWTSARSDELPDQWRGPPRKGPTRPRAPPA